MLEEEVKKSKQIGLFHKTIHTIDWLWFKVFLSLSTLPRAVFPEPCVKFRKRYEHMYALRPRQNGYYFANCIFNLISFKKSYIFVQISLQFVPKELTNNKSPVFHIIVWHRKRASQYLNLWWPSLLRHISNHTASILTIGPWMNNSLYFFFCLHTNRKCQDHIYVKWEY